MWLFYPKHFILILKSVKHVLSKENACVPNAKRKNGKIYLINSVLNLAGSKYWTNECLGHLLFSENYYEFLFPHSRISKFPLSSTITVL